MGFYSAGTGEPSNVFEKARDIAKGNFNKFTLIEELHMPLWEETRRVMS